jgi:hypothetical protein
MQIARASFAALALGFVVGAAQAETFGPNGIFDSAAIYNAQGVDLNLKEVPKAIFSGDWKEEPSYFTGVGLGKTRSTLGDSFPSLQSGPFGGIKHGYELIYLQHRGRQTNAELAAAYWLRTPDLELGPLGVNFAAGAGLSHAFGTPSYEDGSADNPNKRYRTQLLATFEFEWKALAAPNFSLVTRLHHRSGVYGLVAPRRVGSNFAVVGLRYRF